MAVFGHQPEDDGVASRARVPLIAGVAIVALALGVAWWWGTRPEPPAQEAPEAPAGRAEPGPRTEPRPTAPAESAPAEAPPEARRRARPAPTPEAPAAPEPAPPAEPQRELIVESDVDGALVFLDRQFLGNAPVRTTEVTAGSHQVNVSAEGHEGVAQTIEVAESGPTTVTIRLKDVRLNESVEVVHKHAMGSCQGRLTADLKGFRFTPQKGNDGFSLPLDAVEAFEIDYLKKNLRLKRKGGRTWNFESPTGTADPLFVFHRDVEKARTKLAAGR